MTEQRVVERKLWDYLKNVERIRELRARIGGLMSMHGHEYKTHVLNGVSDPVSEIVCLIMKMEATMLRVEREVRAVEELWDKLDMTDARMNQMRQVLEYRYILHMKAEAVMRKAGITKATYWRRVHSLLRMATKYI